MGDLDPGAVATTSALATEISALIREARSPRRPVVVGLDGRSGAGKSTLAAAVAATLGPDEAGRARVTVVDGDSFYAGGSATTWDRLPPAAKAARVIDWRRQRAVLLALRDRGEATWQPFDWDAPDWDREPPPLAREPVRCRAGAVVVLEGAYSCRPELHDLLDRRVLLAVSPAIRRARLRAREGEHYRIEWERRWSEAEDHYFTAVMPPDRFDLVLREDAGPVDAFESVSSWRQPRPPAASAARTRLIERIAARVAAIRPARVRVVVDGYTASGKTSFAHELAAAVRALGRPTMRATFDDFKKPWADAREKGYDRVTGDGYYRNAFDFDAARRLLLEPAGPEGSGRVVLCGFDPLTGEDHRDTAVRAPSDAVLIVDSVFGMRPEYDDCWDLRIWLDVPAELALARGIERDTEMEGSGEVERLHRDRYHVAEQIYVSEVDPLGRADVIIGNADFANPAVVRW